MLDTVTHVVGPIIKVYDRIVQRCSLCGEKLLDSIGVKVRASEAGLEDFATHPEGALLTSTPPPFVVFFSTPFWVVTRPETMLFL